MNKENEFPKTMFLSKYALTGGIKQAKFIDVGDGYVREEASSWSLYKIGTEVHETHAGAVTAAEAARLKKIKSLKAHLKKLEVLTFAEVKEQA